MTSRMKKYTYRLICVALAMWFVLSAFVAGTYAWNNYSSHKTNEASGMPVIAQVILQKLEKTLSGTATGNFVPGAEFYLYKAGDPDVQVGGRYVTDQNGQIRVQGLTKGKYYFLETNPGYGYTYDQDVSGAPITRYDFEITGLEENNRLTVTAYNRRLEGPLTIKKLVVNADGTPLTDEQLALEFVFTVTFSDGGAYSYRIDGGAPQTVASGGTIKLKHGQTAVFENIPVGVQYKVVETEHPGYTAGSENHQGQITQEGSFVLFTNTYRGSQSGNAGLTVQKEVAGEIPASEAGRVFHFVLEVEGRQPERFELKAGQSITWKDLPAGAKYTVYEDGIPDGYVLSGVTGGDGTLNLGPNTAIFTNKFTGTVTVPVEGEKTWDLQGYQQKLPESITIYLKKGDVVVDTAVVKPDKNGKWTYAFNAPKYEPDGVTEIRYTIEEAPVEHFRPVYNGMNVRNVYVPPVTADSVQVVKTIEGEKAPKAPFKFVMTAMNNAPMPDGAVNGRKTITINGAGKASFGKIRYTKPGVYTYSIIEQNTGENGWTYDSAVYTYTVKVIEKDGTLKVASRTLTKNGKTADKAVFHNRYSSPPAPPDKIEIMGTKTWVHGANQIENYPESILVYVKVGDIIVAQRTVTASDHWTYIFRLPKYDGDGKEIIYTIDEEKVPGYQKTVDGYDLINTYDPNDPDGPHGPGNSGGSGDPDDPNGSGGAQTGDNRNIWPWMLCMLLSLAALVAAQRLRPKQRRLK